MVAVSLKNTEMQIREYNGQRVVTFKDIDRVHENKAGTAYRNFNRNRKYFVEGEDFFVLTKEFSNVTNCHIRNISVPNKGITVLTETGYLMIVKSFSGDLAWSVQRQLVNNYFEKRVVQNVIEEKPKVEKYELKVAINPDWYERNRGRLHRICEREGITYKKLYHKILKEVGEYYDLEEASMIFYNEVGHYPNYAIDIVSYFRELGEMADKILDRLDG